MTMQVSTSSLFSIPRNAVVDLQGQITKAETEVSTNQLADPAESLGSQLGLYETLKGQSSNLGNIQSSNAIIQSTLSASQNALTQIASDAKTFVSALITAQSSGDVTTLQAQAQALMASFTSTMNSTSGEAYIFGGTNSSVAPLADYSQGPQAATAAAFQAAFGMSQSSSQVGTISAAAMQAFLTGPFANLFQGASWTSSWSQASSTATSALISPTESVTTSVTANASAFQELANAYTSIADLAVGNLSATTQQAVLSNALSQASTAQQGITGLQTMLGISQSQITNANNQMQAQASLIDNWVSQLGGVDSYQAASTLTNLTTQLETAYSLTNRISKLSLVNYLT
jgi:flagellar hook-associated protein 3 FlgL